MAAAVKALRKRDPDAAKPYNFALSPILVEPSQDCTLVAPFSKHPEEWLTRPYTEIHSGAQVYLSEEYKGKRLLPQTLSGILWRHYLHPEDKSLAPNGERSGAYTSGLLFPRPIQAMLPFRYIGKEIERKAQEGEDIAVIAGSRPIQYQAHQTPKTRAADPRLILRAKRFGLRTLIRESGVHQHVVERFLGAKRVHPATRARLLQAVEKLEREFKRKGAGHAIQKPRG